MKKLPHLKILETMNSLYKLRRPYETLRCCQQHIHMCTLFGPLAMFAIQSLHHGLRPSICKPTLSVCPRLFACMCAETCEIPSHTLSKNMTWTLKLDEFKNTCFHKQFWGSTWASVAGYQSQSAFRSTVVDLLDLHFTWTSSKQSACWSGPVPRMPQQQAPGRSSSRQLVEQSICLFCHPCCMKQEKLEENDKYHQ